MGVAKYKGIEVKDGVRQLLPHMPLIRSDIVPNIPAAPFDVLAFP